uniref:Retrotransposon protein, putative, Ty1-copia subclass n=1 Tax=Oryza sativa subsp. japonica TaxID=39947 RepID=Q339E8_ORYSJ|nr:retrotransposon protein, putative, Ty1-copia subclass [Oryza sativa Japonica Group]
MSTEIGDKEVNDINGGNTASKSSGGTFLGYTFILLILLDVSLLMFFAMAALRYSVNVDAYFILSMLKLYTSSTITRSTHIANVMFIVLIFWIKICRIMTKFPTVQKLDRSFSEEDKFEATDYLFREALISVLANNIVDVYMHIPSGKDMWGVLEAKFEAHEIQMLIKELENNHCELPDKFVAGGIIAKLPPSWSDFATSLKHKRQEFSVTDLIGSLGIEEKARAKDNRGKKIEGGSSANLVQKNNPHASHNNNKKVKPDVKPKATTNFKKKGKGKAKGDCFVCGKPGHWAKDCPERKDKKSANMVISEEGGTLGYGKFLPTVLSICYSPDWWVDTGANIHVCVDISLFSSYQVGRGSSLLMGNGSLAAVHGVDTVDLKFTLGKIVQLKNVQHVPSIKKNLVSGSLLYKDGFRLVFESNKCGVSKYGTFIGKGYDSGGLFRFSLDDMCNKVVNHVSDDDDESNVWHSRLCHVNFGCMTSLANMSLIPKFTLVKGSKCHTCVQSKQPRKPHKAFEARNLAPLELVHSDLCEMNGVLTKGGKKYFMTLIDDCTRFCYVYLLKTKDEALHYFKIYKAEVENQLERKIKRLRSDRGGEYFSNEFTSFCEEYGIIHERTPPYSPQSNGVAERKNRTLTEMVNAMLDTVGLSKEWWGEAILIACHVLNRIPTKHKEENPEEDNIVATRKSKRQRTAKSFGDDYIVYLVDDTPRTIEEAYSSPDTDYWKEAVRSEMDSIMSNGTWEVVERPYGCKPVGCKWVFKKKLRPDGTIEKYKARLVAKGYTQKEGEDFFDTYSPVARLTTIRVLLALAASHGLLIHQMDVKTAFLNGELEEEIYMDQPDGYVLESQEGMVCKLLKSLYGLKQAPKQWHEKFDNTLTSAGFVVNEADKCVYYRCGGGEGVILCLYVDDILIFGTSLNVIEEVKDFLSKSFEMTDLRVADVILNIKLLRGDEGGITLVQSHYVDKVLSRFGYSDCKAAPTPYDPSVLLRKNRRIARDQLRYSQIIGSLMYLASATRPDISFAVSKLS